MTIKIMTKPNPNGEEYKNLKFSREMMPFEYAVISKNNVEPFLDKEGTYGRMIAYDFNVLEINTIDENTGLLINSTETVKASMFVTEKLNELIANIAVNKKFKLFKQKQTGNKGEYFTYEVEILDQSDVEDTEVTVEALSTEDTY